MDNTNNVQQYSFNVKLLALSQALIFSASSMIVFIGSIIADTLIEDKTLITLPMALLVVGTAAGTMPAALCMRLFGRRNVFVLSCVLGALANFLAAYALTLQNFYLFCSATGLIGVNWAVTQQYRFAAIESVDKSQAATATSTILLGGILAAWMGPEVAIFGKELLDLTPYSGSFIIMGILFSFAAVFVWLSAKTITPVQPSTLQTTVADSDSLIFDLKIALSILGAVTGYFVMTSIMTATPGNMHLHHGFDLESTKFVIQSHIMAMFLPALITPILIKRFGIRTVMLIGILAYCLTISIAFLDSRYIAYWFSLVLLGIGWNFLFVGSTTLLATSFSHRNKFKIQGLNDSFVFTAQAIGALGAGWIMNSYSWNALLLICFGFIFAYMIISTIDFYRSQKPITIEGRE